MENLATREIFSQEHLNNLPPDELIQIILSLQRECIELPSKEDVGKQLDEQRVTLNELHAKNLENDKNRTMNAAANLYRKDEERLQRSYDEYLLQIVDATVREAGKLQIKQISSVDRVLIVPENDPEVLYLIEKNTPIDINNTTLIDKKKVLKNTTEKYEKARENVTLAESNVVEYLKKKMALEAVIESMEEEVNRKKKMDAFRLELKKEEADFLKRKRAFSGYAMLSSAKALGPAEERPMLDLFQKKRKVSEVLDLTEDEDNIAQDDDDKGMDVI